MNPDEAKAISEARTFVSDVEAVSLRQLFYSRVALSQHGNWLHPLNHHLLKSDLIERIRALNPFSLVRLGDGEGNVLFWGTGRQKYPNLSELCMRRIWRIHHGRAPFNQSTFARLYEGISRAIQQADIVGIPTPEQHARASEKLRLADEKTDIRGLGGVVSVSQWFGENTVLRDVNDLLWVNCHVHKSLIDFLPSWIAAAPRISVVTCYPGFLDALERSFNAKRGETYLIPFQATNEGKTPELNHFPDVFDQISEVLERSDLSGQLFLIGAGLAGKVYADLVRSSGGMAIDVGSMIDVLMGRSVRGYQTADYVERYDLTKS